MPLDDILHDYSPEEAESDEEYQERQDQAEADDEARMENDRDLALEDGHD
jgi:hypothetical protein